MIIKKDIDINAPLTEAQKAMIENSIASEIVFDEDCPELTDEEINRLEIYREHEEMIKKA